MNPGTHLIAGASVGYIIYGGNILAWWPAILGSVLPDIIGESCYQIGRIAKKKKIKFVYDKEITLSCKDLANSIYLIPYNTLHSVFILIAFFLLSLPAGFIIAYATHIALDSFSHEKETWGIMLFWPLSKKRYGGKKNWWEWKAFEHGRWKLFLIGYILIFAFVFTTWYNFYYQ